MEYCKSLKHSLFLGAALLLTSTVATVGAAEEPVGHESLNSILESGRKQDRKMIPRLRRLKARKGKEFATYTNAAQMALAKLGERRELDEILEESRSDEADVRSNALEKLAYVGGKTAINALAAQLEEKARFRATKLKMKDGSFIEGDAAFPPPSHQAMAALEKLVPDPPEYNRDFPGDADVEIWKAWWKANKKKYQ